MDLPFLRTGAGSKPSSVEPCLLRTARCVRTPRAARRGSPAAGAIVAASLLSAFAGLSPESARAARGDCAQPVSTGATVTTTDCLFILQAAVGSTTCDPECVCAPTGELPIGASDALVCLLVAVGGDAALECPCGGPAWFPVDLTSAVDLGHVPARISPEQSRPAGAVTLVDATDEAGLADLNAGGNLHGVGVAFADLSGDGLEDIVVISGKFIGSPTTFDSAVYLNDGDGTFSDVSDSSGLAAILDGIDGYSVAAADYDADGDIDLYIGAHPRDILIENRAVQDSGVMTFVDATSDAGAGGPFTAQSGDASKIVSFGDIDGDGWADLVSASRDIPGAGLYLLRNEGDGTFSDVTIGSGAAIQSRGNPCAVLWTDFDNDTDPDLHVWNDRGGRVLLRNEGNLTFSDVTTASLINSQAAITHPMGIDGADIDHDGDLDYYVSNVGNNPLLSNNGDGTFTNITQTAGTGGEFGWGLGFEDFNNDSWADIFVGQEDNLPYLVFTNPGASPMVFSRSEFAHPTVISRVRAHNVAVAFADYDDDGRTDVLTATTDGSRVTLYRNTTDTGSNRWLEVVVPVAPDTGAAGGATARVLVKTGDLVQFREIYGGSSRASQNALSARFGLGDWSGADYVAVQWQTGAQTVVTGVEGNQRLVMP